jgi:hypothetical protein
MAMLYCLRSSFGPETKLNQVESLYKSLSDNENINLKMPSFLWQGNLPNQASKIKRLLDIHLPWASVKLHLCSCRNTGADPDRCRDANAPVKIEKS